MPSIRSPRFPLALALAAALATLVNAGEGRAQLVFGNPATAVPAANSVNLCESSPTGFFEINWKTTEAIASGKLIVDLPAGIEYRSGSLERRNEVLIPAAPTYVVQVASLSELEFRFNDPLPAGASGTVRFTLTYDCQVAALFENSYRLDVRATSGPDAFATATAPINTSASEPYVIPVATAASNLSDVVVDATYPREVSVTQTGKLAEAYAFELAVRHDANVVSSNPTLEGVPIAFDASGVASVSQALYPSLPWPLSEGEEWTYREEIRATGCGELETLISTAFGCGPAACQEPSALPLLIELADDGPSVVKGPYTNTLPPDGCIDTGNQIEVSFLVNGRLYSPQLELVARNTRTYIDLSSIEIDYGTGTYAPYAGSFSDELPGVDCSAGEVRRVRLDATGGGPIDATAAAKSIRVRYRVKLCCGNGLGDDSSVSRVYQSITRLEYRDKCGTVARETHYTRIYNLGANGVAAVPGYMAANDVKAWRFDLTSFAIDPELRANATYCFRFTVDPALDVQIPGGVRWVGKATEPVLAAAITDLGGGDYESCFPAGTTPRGAGSYLTFDVAYNSCSPAACGNTAVSSGRLDVLLGGGLCAAGTDCGFPLFEETAETVLGKECCFTDCDGVFTSSAEILRSDACLGAFDDDNDGLASGTLDKSRLALNRAIRGDELAISSRGFVYTNTLPAFDYVTLELIADRDHRPNGTATITVTDASNAATYAVPGVPATVLDERTIQYRLTAADVRAVAGAPALFSFEDDDVVDLEARVLTLENPGCTMEDVGVRMQWFGSTAPVTPAVLRLTCASAPPVPSRYLLVGYDYEVKKGNQDEYGCAGTSYRMSVEFCVGGGTVGLRPFPNEIRLFGTPEAATMEIPPGMTLDQLELVRPEFTLSSDDVSQARANLTSLATQTGQVVSVDFADYFDNSNGGRYPTGGYRFALEVDAQGSCAASTIDPTYSFTAVQDYCVPMAGAAADTTFTRTRGEDLDFELADVDLTSSAPLIEPHDERVSWNFSVIEKGGVDASSHWVALQSPSGGVLPTTLMRNGVILTPNATGFYELGPLRASEVENFTLTADYTACDLDSVLVFGGWNCGAYPLTKAEIVDGTVSCVQSELPLYLNPQPAEVQMAIVAQPTVDDDACASLRYTIELLNVDNAVVYEPTFSVIGPTSDGIQTITSTIQYAYPTDGTPAPGDFQALGIYDRVEATPRGPKYVWELDGKIPEFDAAADQGWDGQLGPDPDARRIVIAFEAETNCLFERGDFLGYIAEGRTYCGAPVASLIKNSRAVNPVNLDLPAGGFLAVDDPGALDLCAGAGAVVLDGFLQYEAATDGGDTLVLDLPPALQYASATSPATELDFANVTVTTVADPGGDYQRVAVPVLAGRAAYERMTFALALSVDDDAATCDVPQPISGLATHYFAYDCNGTPCDSKDTTATLAPLPLSFRQDSISLGALEVTADCDFASVTVDRIAVTVDNVSVPTGTDVPIVLYVDADGSGDFTIGERTFGSFTLPQNTPAGTTVDLGDPGSLALGPDELCNLRAMTDGCTCERAYSAAPAVSAETAGADLTACSPDVVSVGCGPDNTGLGYAYAWTQVTTGGTAIAIDAPDAPQTTLTPDAPLVNADETHTFELVTTGPGGCFTVVDRVDVTYTGVVVAAGTPITACTGFAATLDAPNDPSHVNGAWTPTTGLADPTDPKTEVVIASGTTDYRYAYELPSGCNGAYDVSVTGTPCPDLALAKAIAIAPAVVGDPVTFELTLENTGNGPATGVTVAEALHASLTFVAATPAAEYDAVAGVWTPAGGTLAAGAAATLTITAATTGGGLITNVAQVATLNEDDPDSMPGNDVNEEDDIDGVCVGLPVTVACDDPAPALAAYPGFASYQWQRDGADIPFATGPSHTPTVSGTYRVVIDGGAAAFPDACDVVAIVDECGTFSDFVWRDDDADGVQDPGETGLAGVTVRLFDATDDALVGTEVSDAAGAYVFSRVLLGPYYLTFDAATVAGPQTYEISPQFATATDKDSDPDPATGRTASVSLAASGEVRTDIDAGFVPRDSLVVEDVVVRLDCDATSATVERVVIRNAGAKPVTDDLTVDFYDDVDGDGAADAGEPLLGSVPLADDIPVGDTRETAAAPFAIAPEQACRLLAVASGCVCEVATGPVTELRSANAGPDDSACAPNVLTAGCGANNSAAGYSYAWTPLGSANASLLADATDPNTAVSVPELRDQNVTADYQLATTYPGGCVSYDTVSFAFEGIVTADGPTLTECNGATGVDLAGPTGFTGYAWSPATGLADPSDPTTALTVQSGTQVYTLTYLDAAGCTAEFRQEVTGIGCPDLRLGKAVTIPAAAVGDDVTFTLTVTNDGDGEATGVIVADALPAQLSYRGATTLNGAYDPVAGEWSLTSPLAAGDAVALDLRATVTAGGYVANVAEVIALNETDTDSAPDNGDLTEDDIAGACASVPERVGCSDAPLTLETFTGFSSYEWYRDGVLIPGANSNSYQPDVTATYTVVIDGGATPNFTHACAAEVTVDVCAEVGDRVWLDANRNGLQDPGEIGVTSVVVKLISTSGATVADVTDASGAYLFTEVPSGEYYLEFDYSNVAAPYDVEFAPQDVGPDDAVDSDPDEMTGRTDLITLAGVDLYDYDAGLVARDEIEVRDFEISLGCDLDEVTVERLVVANVGGKPVTDDLTVDFVVDANGDGLAGAGEPVVGSSALTDDIPVGGDATVIAGPFAIAPADADRLLARVGGCACDVALGPITEVATANAGPDVPACPPNLAAVGCSPDVRPEGFAFAWTSADGTWDNLLTNPTSPTTDVTPPADLSQERVIEFVLTTTYPQGSTSEDRVIVTFSRLGDLRGSELSDCVSNTVTLTGPPGFVNYRWTPTTGLADPTDPNTTVTVDFGSTEYTLLYEDDGCTQQYRQTVTGEGCSDLRLQKTVRTAPTAVGQTVTFALTVTNDGLSPTTGVTVFDQLAANLAFERAEPFGQYDVSTGTWTLPGALAPGESRELLLYATVLEGGLVTNVAEVMTADQRDIDATPGNGLVDEDDMDAVCFAVDFTIPCNTAAPTIFTYAGLGSYQWYRDGILVPGATNSSLRVTETGRYTVELDGGLSGYPATCDVQVTVDRCGDVGDYVWVDANGNGLREAGEPGLRGVGVRLYEVGSATPVKTAFTGPAGDYLFRNILVGTYYIVFDEFSADYNVPFRFSPRGQGADDTRDSDADEQGRTRAFDLTAATPTRLDVDAGLEPVGDVAAVKRVSRFNNLRSGHLEITFELGVANAGEVALDNVSLTEDLATQIGPGFVGVSGAPEVFGGVGVEGNGGFDGRADVELFAPGTVLPAGGEILVTLTVEVDPQQVTWPMTNQVRAAGVIRIGDDLPTFDREDLSDSGVDYEGTNPDADGDRGTADDPTPVMCRPLGNGLESDETLVCFGESLDLRSRMAVDGYGYEWRGPGGGPDSTAVLGGGRDTIRVSPSEESSTYSLRLFNAGSMECYYDTEAETDVEARLPPQVITPNDDGANDAFRLGCLGERTGTQLEVFNRWGSLVYASDDYANDWEGTYEGAPLPVGTYFYVLTLPDAGGVPYRGVLAIER